MKKRKSVYGKSEELMCVIERERERELGLEYVQCRSMCVYCNNNNKIIIINSKNEKSRVKREIRVFGRARGMHVSFTTTTTILLICFHSLPFCS